MLLCPKVISARNAARLVDGKGLPEHLAWLANKQDPRNGTTIWSTSIETHAARYVTIHKRFIPAKSYDPPQRDAKGNEIFETPALTKEEYRTRYNQPFSIIILDEAHICKNAHARSWAGIDLMKSLHVCCLTGTPMINTATVSEKAFLHLNTTSLASPPLPGARPNRSSSQTRSGRTGSLRSARTAKTLPPRRNWTRIIHVALLF